MWWALLIPLVISLISFFIWPRKITVLELCVPTVISALAILISYFALKEVNMRDVEYNGQLILEARYYEPYTTWVEQTCSYTTTCCCDSKGGNCQTETHYYDCSYCDEHGARYTVVDDRGSEREVSMAKYMELYKRWSATPQFVELDRHIVYHNGCGKDGDMYHIKWDCKPETSEAEVKEVTFRNPVKVSHSAFKYELISDKKADTLGLYHYPEFYDGYKQNALLAKGIKIPAVVQTKFEYINGYLGPINKVKIFTLLFKNKPIDIAFSQEQYWQGGNQNELVVCIGVDDTLGITWVKPFSWCDNKRICVDTREDIAELKSFYPDSVYDIYMKNIPLFYHYKSFKDFNYLKFEPTSGQLTFVFILTFVISIISMVIAVRNDMDNENN